MNSNASVPNLFLHKHNQSHKAFHAIEKGALIQSEPLFSCAPSMGALLRVQVPSQVDHDERSEAQLHEGDRVWEGSVEHKL
jgi:hypothetical protein